MSSDVRVVALGDSLTVGFQLYGLNEDMGKSTPYTDLLIDRVSRDFPSDSLSIEIVNKGIVGQLTEQMLLRFDSDVVRLSPRVVMILGGSNDLGLGIAPREILQNLSEMYRLSLQNKIVPIACTVPSILGYDIGIPPRILLNKLLQEHCREIGIRCVDVFRATLDQATSRLARQYSCDGLHLSSEGYRKMGAVIYEEGLRPVLMAMFKRDITSGNS
ncbi:MAG TPA: GDSL-type esterase/lipase family protein [Candidatus Acidoferrum sp.]|nr:GDSL-type esterase/lipase family protein [Candidatus Acidoferrum sp.]